MSLWARPVLSKYTFRGDGGLLEPCIWSPLSTWREAIVFVNMMKMPFLSPLVDGEIACLPKTTRRSSSTESKHRRRASQRAHRRRCGTRRGGWILVARGESGPQSAQSKNGQQKAEDAKQRTEGTSIEDRAGRPRFYVSGLGHPPAPPFLPTSGEVALLPFPFNPVSIQIFAVRRQVTLACSSPASLDASLELTVHFHVESLVVVHMAKSQVAQLEELHQGS